MLSKTAAHVLGRFVLFGQGPLLLLLLLIIPFQAATADVADPYKLMQALATRVFGRLEQEQQAITQDTNHVRLIVRQELMPYVHVRHAGALMLGTAFKDLDAAQQERYFQAFRDYIEQSYAQALVLYHRQSYTIEPEKPIGDRRLVSIRVILSQPDGPPLRLDFKWRNNSRTQQWQLYDLVVEGIGLIATKRREWDTLLRQSGIDPLIKQLQISAQKPILRDKIE